MTFTTSTPVYSLDAHRRLVTEATMRVRREEREKIAIALEAQANTVGGLVGAALAQVAADVRGTVGKRAALNPLPPSDYDPAYDYAIEFAALTEEQRQRRLKRRHEEAQESARIMAEAQRAENARIEAERQRVKGLVASGAWNPDTDPPLDEEGALPPVVEHDDEAQARHLAQQRGRTI